MSILRRNPEPDMTPLEQLPNSPIAAHPDVVASRRATALAEVQAMQQDLIVAHDEISFRKREAERLQDRIELILDERNKYRAEAHVFRVKLIELATQMSNINLMTVKANEITMTVNTLIAEEQSREDHEQEQESARALVEDIGRINGEQKNRTNEERHDEVDPTRS